MGNNSIRKATLKMPTRIKYGTLGKDVLDGSLTKELRDRLAELQPSAAELVEKVEEIRNTYNFGTTNLKLHDVSYELYSNADRYEEKYGVSASKLDQAFQWFLESEYWNFEELEAQEGWKREYVGRTSSFYFVTDSASEDEMLEPFYDTNYGNEFETSEVIANLSDYYYSAIESEEIGEATVWLANNDLTLRELSDLFSYNGTPFIQALNDGNLEEYVEVLENGIDELLHSLDDVKEKLDRIQFAYDWLDDYKANQVEYFREWFAEEMNARPELYLDEEEVA